MGGREEEGEDGRIEGGWESERKEGKTGGLREDVGMGG